LSRQPAPRQATFQLAPAASPTRGDPASPSTSELGPPLCRVAATIERQRGEIDRAIREAARGRTFSPSEIVLLQAKVFDYAQNLEVLSQVLDKSVGALKTAVNTQL
jgi:hypothetical protein